MSGSEIIIHNNTNNYLHYDETKIIIYDVSQITWGNTMEVYI